MSDATEPPTNPTATFLPPEPQPRPLPRFASPRRQGLDPLLPGESGTTPTGPGEGGGTGSADGIKADPSSRPSTSGRNASRTTSTTSDKPADPKIAARVAGLGLGLAFAGLGLLARFRRGSVLREPDDDELQAMGEPLGRILARHLPAGWINNDGVDLLEAGAATSAWLKAGPLLIDLPTDPQVPPPMEQQ
jgi:hypothetical protein